MFMDEYSSLFKFCFLLTYDLIRRELSAASSMNNACLRHLVLHVPFSPKSFSWEATVEWTAKQDKKLFCSMGWLQIMNNSLHCGGLL